MRRIKTLLFTLCLVLAFPFGAYASFAPYGPITGYRLGQDGNIIYPSAQAACDAFAPAGGNGSVGVLYNFDTVPNAHLGYSSCKAMRDGEQKANVGVYYVTGPAACPANSTSSGGQCTCTAPNVETPGSGGLTCVVPPNPCTPKAGQTGTTNFTMGYVRSLDPNDYKAVGNPNQIPTNRQVCDGGCFVTLGEATAAWRSETPTSQGLHRISVDHTSTNTGNQCTAGSTPATNPAEPAPTCPGYVGEVNGKLGCYGTASNPVVGSQGSTQGLTPKPGNPVAGEKPSTGEGSGSTGVGRTPATGSGTNSGGPASAAGTGSGYSGGTGTVPKPATDQEQAECGAPGQPPCRIDESGTPEAIGALEFKAHADKYKQEQDAARGTIAGTGDKGFFSGWGSIFFVPPLATCEVIEMPFGKGTIDPCPAVDGTRAVMAYLWALAGLFVCVQMVRKVI